MNRGEFSNLLGLICILVVSVASAAPPLLGQPARVIYVDDDAAGANNGSSWADAFNCLQDALAQATVGPKPVEIRVAQGVYKPDQGADITPGDQTASFRMLNGVTLKGGYAGAGAPDPDARDIALYGTALSGDLKGNDTSPDPLTTKDNSCRVVAAISTDETSVIDGFTITGGGAGWGPCADQYGGKTGVLIEAGSPVIRDCHFVMNYGDGVAALATGKPVLAWCIFDGQGMLSVNSDPLLTECAFSGGGMTSDGARPSLTNCTFDQGGINGRNGSSLILTNCTFRDSKRFFATVDVLDSNCLLTGCLFERNGQGSMASSAIRSLGGILNLEDCRFVGNRGRSIHGPLGGKFTLARCSFIGNAGEVGATVHVHGSIILRDCEFIGNSAKGGVGAIYASGDQLMATGCVFAGNSSSHGLFEPGVISSSTILTQLSNCTFVGNRGRPNTIECWRSPAELSHCIVWNGPDPFMSYPSEQSNVKASYCDIQGGYPGEGNSDVDPCFVAPGFWADPNDPSIELGPDEPSAVWINGDYHLMSQAGRWDRETGTWVRDEVTSACIDAGDPNAPLGAEPFPNGAIVNPGAYGGTAEASKSYFGEPVCETQIAGDINGDCKVDQTDMDILLSHWLMEGADFGNTPPTVTITVPTDGEAFEYPNWIPLYAEAADADGSVLQVTFHMRSSDGGRNVRATDTEPADGWRYDWFWWRNTNVPFEGTYEIWAEALDDDGAVTVSPKISVKLRVTN